MFSLTRKAVCVWNNTVALSCNYCCYGNATVHFLWIVVYLTAAVNNIKLSVWPYKGSNEFPLHFVELQNISYYCYQYKWKLHPQVNRHILLSAINQNGVFQQFTLSTVHTINSSHYQIAPTFIQWELRCYCWDFEGQIDRQADRQAHRQNEERTDGETNKYDEASWLFYALLQNFDKILLTSFVRPSIRLSAWKKTRLAMHGFSLNLVFEYISKICRKKFNFH